MIIRMLYVVLRLLLYYTLSGRPGGYPDDDFRNKKKKKKKTYEGPTGPNANEIDTKKSEMYMANAQILRWDPKQPIFHWLAFGFRVG